MHELLERLDIRHECHVPLAPLTWYGLGGPAKVLAHPASVEQLAALVAACDEQAIPVYVLGSGANLLVADEGVDGLVVTLDEPAFKQLQIDGNVVTAGAGFDLAKLVLETARAGLGGLECLAGIPASVGGAVRMNAGGAFGDIGQAVCRVQVMDAHGRTYTRDRDDLRFGYRTTNIVAPYILQARFELTPDDPDALMRRVKEVFLYKKNSQPLADHSAGCAFRNPDADAGGNPRGFGSVSAGCLIEQAGLKGYRVGGASVSTLHANFIVTHQPCTASDVLAVLEHVHRTVLDRFGIDLQREVVLWP